MPGARDIVRRYRVALAAVAVSAALHAAVFVGMPARLPSFEPGEDVATYTATLDSAAQVEAPPAATSVPKPAPSRPRAHHAHAKARPRAPAPPPEPVVQPEPTVVAQAEPQPESAATAMGPPDPPAGPPTPQPEEAKPEPVKPDVVAMASPTAPPEPQLPPEPEAPAFNPEALPATLSISYALTSAFADGRADYEWKREGDTYRIHGEAQAEGFFTLFLEGRIVQESSGTVTSAGLRPDRFTERRPGAEEEGLEFDWPQHQVTFEKGSQKKTTAFTGDTVDWLSMIFQLAHVPPKPKGDTMELAVFTQRRFYSFHLKVLGVEEIDIPLGHVQALHLRHVDAKNPNEIVDVWLGVDQHYLPVKMRYPVAKNRLVVEQSATSVSAR
ncbi:MAG TPA: DUF3108 domain-containing protein [Usitatibacter sp.]|nr:DUF3108 domain-containing protein [Usitatibacter sp.]